MTTSIIKAAQGAADWLAKAVKAGTMNNPIPYGLLKSCIDKRIEWATKDGVTLDPDKLEQLIRQQLQTVGIQAMPNKFRKPQQQQQVDTLFNNQGNPSTMANLLPSLYSKVVIQRSDENGTARLFKWLVSVLDRAEQDNSDSICFTAQFERR